LAPGPLSIEVNGTQALAVAKIHEDDSRSPLTSGLTWRSSDIEVATVDNSGVVKGVGPGRAFISASFSGKSGTVAVTVTAKAIPTSLSISPDSLTLNAERTEGIVVFGHYRGEKGEYSLRIRSGLTFTSSAGEVATVSASGVVTGVATGNAVIKANAFGLSAEVGVTVNPPCPVISDRLHPVAKIYTEFIPSDFDASPGDPTKYAYIDLLVNGCEYEGLLGIPSANGAYRSTSIELPLAASGGETYSLSIRRTGGSVFVQSDPLTFDIGRRYLWYLYGHMDSLQQGLISYSSSPEAETGDPPVGRDRVWVVNMDYNADSIDVYSWRNLTDLNYLAFDDVPYGTARVLDFPSADMDWTSTTVEAMGTPNLLLSTERCHFSLSGWGRNSIRGFIVFAPLSLGNSSSGECIQLNESPISVSSGTPPQYSWQTGDVQTLLVMRGSKADANYVWGISTSSGEDLASPVTQGSIPQGADELFSKEISLTAGVQYTVEIIGVNTERWWAAEFTP
jgi:hypothetical protein